MSKTYRGNKFSIMRTISTVAALYFVLLSPAVQADVKLALPFTERMVLQRDMAIPVWGTADKGEKVTVEFAGQTKTASADADGGWTVTLAPLKASAEAGVLTVRGQNTLTLKDVLVGEVWLCSGQSNMEASIERLMGKNSGGRRTATFRSPEVKAAVVERCERELATTTPGIRLFRVGRERADSLKNAWRECNPEAMKNHPPYQGFSAAAYFFARELHAELKVPIGVIESAVGGSRIEAWTPAEAYADLPAFKTETASSPVTIDGVQPGKHFRAMIQPLAPFALRGVIWYQGESNVINNDGLRYADKMEALIRSWRRQWQQPDLPFYYVQLPRFDYTRRHKNNGLTAASLAWLARPRRWLCGYRTPAWRLPWTWGTQATFILPTSGTSGNVLPGWRWPGVTVGRTSFTPDRCIEGWRNAGTGSCSTSTMLEKAW